MVDGVKASSNVLVRLDAEISAARSSIEADSKRAERAAYLSRLGRAVEARHGLDEIRVKYVSHPNAEISSWLHLAEGLITHFNDMSPHARESILRAHALSSAANAPRVRALSAAWLAHMDYLQVKVGSMRRHALEALHFSSEEDHPVRSRVGLVIAQALHLADRLDLALPWYGSARSHASADEDEATLSALMHNMAWLRAQRLRAADCELVARPASEERYALLGVESTKNFDILIGSTSLAALVPMLRAQVLTVRGQYTEALALFETEMIPALRSGMARLQSDLLADQAWCHLKLQQRESALQLARTAEASIDRNGQFDDRALAHGRLAQTFLMLDLPEEANRNRALAEQAWAGHVLLQAEIVRSLEEMPPPKLAHCGQDAGVH
jgi:hypothetical protein